MVHLGYDPDNQRFLGQETWDDSGTRRMRLGVYLGGDCEDVLPESGNTYSRVERIQATSAACQIGRRYQANNWETPYFDYIRPARADRRHLGGGNCQGADG